MSEKIYKFNTNKKNQALALWALSRTRYKAALICCILSVVIGVLLFIFLREPILGLLTTKIAPIRNNKSIAYPITIVLSIIIALIPVYAAYRLQARVLSGIEEPYRSMINEFIRFKDSTFEYIYHYKPNPNPTVQECYMIKYEAIEEIVFRDKYCIMTIYGKGVIKLIQNKVGYLNVVETSSSETSTEAFSLFVAVNNINDFLQTLSNFSEIKVVHN